MVEAIPGWGCPLSVEGMPMPGAVMPADSRVAVIAAGQVGG